VSLFEPAFINDTEIDATEILAGSQWFEVAEVEVFEISDSEPAPVQPIPPPAVDPTAPVLDSLIISGFPEIFAEFRGKKFSLLWRGSRDGFTAEEFHRRCDNHPNTLTVVLDDIKSIFGGFTPLEWESPQRRSQELDGSRKSFMFTLRNPYRGPPRKFPLKEPWMSVTHTPGPWAIIRAADTGPFFGYPGDFVISDNCNESRWNALTTFGENYVNDSGLGRWRALTRSARFLVEEIEVFEITDYSSA
jgi:hypothetical protein